MRLIKAETITAAARELAISAAYDLAPELLEALLLARDRESSELSRDVLDLLLSNSEIASRERIPLCQDTGMVVVFVELGRAVRVDGDLSVAIEEGVRQGYREAYLRNSVCDPLTRLNSNDNTPAVIHLELVAGDSLTLRLLPKGCGSENMSSLAMLSPALGKAGIVRYVVEQVVAAGPNPCPPLIVGVGVGGNFELAAYLAKKSLCRPLGQSNARLDAAQLEAEILSEINQKGVGVHGFGGNNTALAVHLELFPTHIASMPVAVNIQCHAHRQQSMIL